MPQSEGQAEGLEASEGQSPRHRYAMLSQCLKENCHATYPTHRPAEGPKGLRYPAMYPTPLWYFGGTLHIN